jgi:hypothetical protein
MVNLSIALFGVLLAGIQIEAWPPLIVETVDDLLASFILGGYVFRSEAVGTVFSPPDQGIEESFRSLGNMPFRGPEVPEDAFPRQPKLLVLCDGRSRCPFSGGIGYLGPCGDCSKDFRVFGLLLGGELRMSSWLAAG